MYVFLVSAQNIPSLEVFTTETALMDESIEMGLNVIAEFVFPLGYFPTDFTLPQHVIGRVPEFG